MEFWGVEVKAGETLKVSPGEGKLIHISQASNGDSNKAKAENIQVFVKVNEKKLVIGTLSADKFPQIQYDIVFEKDFELSHNGKNGSVFFCGYKVQNPVEEEGYSSDSEEFDESDSDSDSDDELPLENGKPAIAGSAKPTPGAKDVKVEDAKAVKVEDAKAEKIKDGKAEKIKGAKAVKVEDARVDSDEDSSDEDDSDDEDSKAVKVEDAKADSDDDSSDEDGSDDEDSDDSDDDEMDADDSDDEDVSSEEEVKAPTPKKNDKRRPAETTAQVSAKKAKLVTPQKTGVKKPAAAAVHTATPHPGKQVGKTSKIESSKTPSSAGKSHSNAKRAAK